MITVIFYAKKIGHKVNTESITGFRSEGHAGFAGYGKDIVCAAVSALVMNTVNSVHAFTTDVFFYDTDEKKGMIEFRITSAVSPESGLLLRSLLLGLESIREEYGEKYLRIVFQNSQGGIGHV